jgi:hypothetical protein
MITRDKLNELNILTKKVNDAKEQASELLRIAQDRFNDKTHKVEREGKTVELTEKTLWDEVFYLGTASQAAKILQKEHPEVFEKYREQDVAALELMKFAKAELGINYKEITLADYLQMTEQLFSLLISEHNNESGK